MGLNDTPSANRVHIAFFGRRNAGKSSLVNAVTGQNLALVSEVKGTTTDPVYKAMELLPLGPVVIIDTPGIDDEGALGELRAGRARQVLNKTDAAVLVLDGEAPPGAAFSADEEKLAGLFKEKKIPYIIALNKSDLLNTNQQRSSDITREIQSVGSCSSCGSQQNSEETLLVSAKTGFNIELLKEKIAALAVGDESKQQLAADLVNPGDFAVLVVPIDKSAPRGRLILPQQQVIRSILDAGAAAVVVRDSELKETLAALGKKPAVVITDSQVFAQVSAETPNDIPLTSFSILFARYKGFLQTAVKGAAALETLNDGGKILIAEGCTHHRQCGDIGTVKIPRLIKQYTSKEPAFDFCSGGDFPQDLSPYKLIIHCGACMLNDRETQRRCRCAEEQGVPFTNYGIAIAHMQGILKRSIALFNE